jgi:hypothetical protein
MSEILYTGQSLRGLDPFRLVRTLLFFGDNKGFNEGLKGGACHSFPYRNFRRKGLRHLLAEGLFLKGTMGIVGGE